MEEKKVLTFCAKHWRDQSTQELLNKEFIIAAAFFFAVVLMALRESSTEVDELKAFKHLNVDLMTILTVLQMI